MKLNDRKEYYFYSLNFSGYVPYDVDQYIGSFLKLVLRYIIDLYLKVAYKCISESITTVNNVLISTIKSCRLIGITHIDVDGISIKLDDLCVDDSIDVDYNDEVDTLFYKYYVLFNKVTRMFKDFYVGNCNISIFNSLTSLFNVVLNNTISMIGYLENSLATIIILSLVCIVRCLILINVHYYKNFISHINIMVNINYLLFIIFIVSLISNGLLNSISKYNSIVILSSGMYVLYVQLINDRLILNNNFNYKLKLTMCAIILIICVIWNKIRYIKINQLIPTIYLLLKKDRFCINTINVFAFYTNYITYISDISYKYNVENPKFDLSYIFNKRKLDILNDSNEESHDDKKTENSNLFCYDYKPIKLDFMSTYDKIDQTKEFGSIELKNCMNLFKSIKNLPLDFEENELKQKLTKLLTNLLKVKTLLEQIVLYTTQSLNPRNMFFNYDFFKDLYFLSKKFNYSLKFACSILPNINNVLISTIKSCRLIGITHIDVDGISIKLDDLCVDDSIDVDYNDEVDTLFYKYYVLFNKVTRMFKDFYVGNCNISIFNSLTSLFNVVLNNTISMIGYLENSLATIIILSLVCIVRCLILINVHYYKNFISHINIMVNINYLLFIIFIVSLISNGLLNSISKYNSIVILSSGMYVLYVQLINDRLILNNNFNYKLKLTMCAIILIICVIWNKIRYIKINQLIPTIYLFFKKFKFAYDSLLHLSYNHNYILTRCYYNDSRYVKINVYRENIQSLYDIREKLKSVKSNDERKKLKNELKKISYIEPNIKIVKNFMVNLNLAIDKQIEANSLFNELKKTAHDLFKILNNSNHLSEFTMKETLKQKLQIALKSKSNIESVYKELKEFSNKFKLKPHEPNIDENYNSYDLVAIFKTYIEVTLEYALLTISDINDILISTIKSCRLIGITHIDIDGISMKLDDLCVDEPINSISKNDLVDKMNSLLSNVVSFDRFEFILYMLNPEFVIKSFPIND
ncbi:conserved hypothetical protein [Theileria orientalis strain Shintoku]|uniref:Uncharacterized protein n=1 Tax=Theileria orientalis strain Shintoku TaxID=869250 RepID=J4DNN6_THEOR|nr:conserved hypothetical protein [Theileria orientalis strain Shintoku]BAM39274.1 conserved hypothetical protein [Theileria orientalis strain Shintoku]|eukprot:XP_009689575.1 conserved hypothetical protein [Theileria orientalis strain Shintoku]